MGARSTPISDLKNRRVTKILRVMYEYAIFFVIFCLGWQTNEFLLLSVCQLDKMVSYRLDTVSSFSAY